MSNCGMCGRPIPSGQVCSMCYGDPDYGQDGYYLQWLMGQEEEYRAREEAGAETAKMEHAADAN